MKAILVVAQTGQGKTTFTKNLLSKVNKNRIIYDVNGEYKEFYNKPFIDFETFLKQTKSLTNSMVVFEEATMFFSNRGNSKDMVEMLVRKRHTNNFYILLFHSLRAIPTYILDLCNYLVLFKTNDNPALVESKFNGWDSIINSYNQLKEAPDHSFIEIKLV